MILCFCDDIAKINGIFIREAIFIKKCKNFVFI